LRGYVLSLFLTHFIIRQLVVHVVARTSGNLDARGAVSIVVPGQHTRFSESGCPRLRRQRAAANVKLVRAFAPLARFFLTRARRFASGTDVAPLAPAGTAVSMSGGSAATWAVRSSRSRNGPDKRLR
jgi:hypothetical protein